jgi:hypothetical protein
MPEQKIDNKITRRECVDYRDNNCEPTGRQDIASGKIVTATKAIRAITAIVFFAVPRGYRDGCSNGL